MTWSWTTQLWNYWQTWLGYKLSSLFVF